MTHAHAPILYSFRRCPYAMRARLCIKAAGQTLILREIILRDKPAHMLEISPKGTVPVLLLPDGHVIDESLDIALWALGTNDPLGLKPDDPTLYKQMLGLVLDCEQEFKPHLDRTKYHTRYTDADPVKERALANLFLAKLNERLNTQPYLFGEKQTMADLLIAPFVRQFANIDKALFNEQQETPLKAWLEVFLSSELFLSVMEKYPPWQEGDKVVYFG